VNVKDEIIYPSTLKGFFVDNYCYFHFTGYCKDGSKCQRKHMQKNNLFKQLQKIIADPMKIYGIETIEEDILKFIKEKTPIGENNLEPYLTTCMYDLKGSKCGNYERKRFIEYDIKFNNTKITVYICHPDISKYGRRIPCGIHYDIEYTNDNDFFKVTKIISIANTKSPNIKKKQKNNKKSVDLTLSEFPQLSSTNNIIDKKINNSANIVLKETKKIDNNEGFNKFNGLKRKFILVNDNKDKPLDVFNSNLSLNDIDNKTTDELKDLVKELLIRNDELMKRNIDLSHTNEILSLPVPRHKYSSKLLNNHSKIIDDLEEYLCLGTGKLNISFV
jgi:hypothetical protein